MCAAVGGTLWLGRRFSKKKQSGQQMQQKEEAEEASKLERTQEQQDKLAIVVTEINEE